MRFPFRREQNRPGKLEKGTTRAIEFQEYTISLCANEEVTGGIECEEKPGIRMLAYGKSSNLRNRGH